MSYRNRQHHIMFLFTLVTLALGAGSTMADAGRRPRIIRPPDDRADYFATTATLQRIGDSVCAQVTTDALVDNGNGTFTINAGTLADNFNPLCAGERFADQPTAASCTATLVGPNTLITAGHCLDDNGVRTDLNTIFFVFDYAVKQEGVNPATFTRDQVYRATEILGLANEANTANDWAVLRLDRAVTGRTPVAVRSNGSIAQGQSIVAIGFGAGLPMKFSDNATVQQIVPFGFEADLDIVEGNSGGPIINADTGMIEAVLSADQAIPDYFQDGNCFRATACPQDPGCDASFTLLASVMTAEFQSTIQNAIGGAGGGGGEGDSDGDNVVGAADLCPNTPQGVEVDENGCELDNGGQGNNGGGGFVRTSPCGFLGIIPLGFMTACLVGVRVRRYL